ncbi:hypothetical protein Kfla_1030 [Kribbella flavida DSM 17836]|uniref:Predicted membrane protein YciQ-like C-terminal domain-containing protein n=1 Tax=Kribbella flavida (strain DSM 17836 / JCM 10339 / NBRC 14399) TaxID=479435 RepID=D2Q1E7_KRIFD|nr:DUF2207 domain-containing protein [Kribbella flavida]ADB30135.1 hypothetical protein Kfla_1030 [Kribbella flavida DSM 17836]
MRLRLLGVSLCALGVLAGTGVPAGASGLSGTADPVVTNYDSEVRVERDGALKVSESWKLSNVTGTFTRFLLTRDHLPDDVDHVQEIADLQVKAGGETKKAEVSTEGDITSIAVEDVSGDAQLDFTYTVRGAVATTLNGTELRFTPLTGLALTVQDASIVYSTPQVTHVSCFAGAVDSNHPCTLAQLGETAGPTFRQQGLPPGNTVRMTVGFPEGEIAANAIVEYRKTFQRAFSTDTAQLVTALLVLLLGAAALLALYRLRGRDQVDPRRVVPASLFSLGQDARIDFTPPADLRPGEVGTLIDERIDPVDVTATIIDLAVRGHLTITELEHATEFARPDWELKRVAHAPAEQLQRYENVLLRAIFGDNDTVLVSELGKQVRANLGQVQDALYDGVVKRGWFTERPDRTRSLWATIGIGVTVLGVILTVLLALFSTWGLLGIAITAVGVGLLAVGRHMPAKAPAAGRVLGQVAAIRGELLEMDVSELPSDQHAELCSRALPYAVVLGGSERWIDALVATDVDDSADEGFHWYRGPRGWHLQYLPDSLRNLTTNLTGALFTR